MIGGQIVSELGLREDRLMHTTYDIILLFIEARLISE